MATPQLTPGSIAEHLKDMSDQAFKDASAIYELLGNLKSVSGQDAKMLYHMSDAAYKNGMVYQEAANLVNELLKLRAEKQLIQDNPGRE